MKREIVIAVLVISILILLTSHAMAQEGRINIGKLKVVPGLTIQELYDDNIYLGSGTTELEAEESDLITHAMPALALNYAFPERGRLALGYDGDLAYYSDNDDNDWKTHKGLLDFSYQAPGGLMLGINDIYTDAEDPYGNPELYRLGLKTERWHNDLKTKIGYDLGSRFKIMACYNYYKQDYELEEDYTQAPLGPADRAMLDYVAKLTRTPAAVTADDTRALREAGFDDRSILDIVQITAYFAFVTRLADGLGVQLEDW